MPFDRSYNWSSECAMSAYWRSATSDLLAAFAFAYGARRRLFRAGGHLGRVALKHRLVLAFVPGVLGAVFVAVLAMQLTPLALVLAGHLHALASMPVGHTTAFFARRFLALALGRALVALLAGVVLLAAVA